MASMPPSPPPEPLSLDEVKLNLRVDDTSEDDLITGLIVDAREYVERETGLVLVPRTITETAPCLGAYIELASWPVSSISAIRYPLAGVMTPLADGAWLFSPNRRPIRLLPASFAWGVGAVADARSALPVEIDVEAGYADVSAIPRLATRAMHMLIDHYYTNRSTAEVGVRAAAIEVPFGVTALLGKLKLTRV